MNEGLLRIQQHLANAASGMVSDKMVRDWYIQDVRELLELSANLVETILEAKK